MKLPRSRFTRLLLASAAALAFGPAHAADPYPQRPVSLVVGYAAGGTTDAVARALADVLAPQLKGSLVIDNVPGAAGALGAYKAARAPADGYTLLVGADGELVTTRLLNPKQPYDGAQDFKPIAMVARLGGIFVASRQSGIRTTDEFVKALRANPGKYNYATIGTGNLFHFAGETLRQRTKTTLAHVPYKSVSNITTDLGGGVIEFAFLGTGTAKGFIDNGLVTPIGVTRGTRLPMYPQVPALAEHPELRGFDFAGWFAVMAPKGLPEPVAERLRVAVKAAIQDERFRKAIEGMGGQVATGDEDIARHIREDTARYQALVDSLKLVDAK